MREAKNSRAKTKKFTRVFTRKFRPQSACFWLVISL
ncbi:DUF1661 domain-containing protein [Porphyromonas gulae]|nr:DUF1661 domain-containing protein [Porphyromonas gulae]